MSDTPFLSLPTIAPAQAQKHVTHNEALRRLDLLVQLSVADADRAAPPATPAEGARHVVAPGATGAWAGQSGRVAVFETGLWQFAAPAPGWRAWVRAEGALRVFDGTAWIPAAAGGGGAAPTAFSGLDGVGIGTGWDPVNRLSVAADAVLFSHAAGGDQRLKLNKAGAADTASLVFQTGFAGRAEMGLAGQEDFTLKVRAGDGPWAEALRVEGASGRVRLGAGLEVAGPAACAILSLAPTPVADLPDPAAAGAGAMAHVVDAPGGGQPAYCDGAAWRLLRDGTVI